MALEWHTGLEGLPVGTGTAAISQYFTATSGSASITSTTVRNGSRALSLNANNVQKYGGVLSNATTRVLGFGVRLSAFSDGRVFACLSDGSGATAGNVQVGLAITASGALQAYRGRAIGVNTSGTALGSASTNVLATDTWYFVELVVTHHASTGTVEVFVNGSKTNWIDLTGQNTANSGNAYSNGFAFGYSGGTEFVDDVYTLTGSGGARTTRLGDCRSVGCIAQADSVSGAGDYNDSTPLSGSDRGAMVDDASTDDDTTYNALTAATQRDAYKHSAVGISGTVFGVTSRFFLKKSDAGAASAKVGIRSSTTDDYSAEVFPSDASYAVFEKLYEQNPATASDWSTGTADSSQLLVRRES